MTPAKQADTAVARLRKAGFKVVVTAMPGRPYAFTPKAVLLHHTASTSTTSSAAEKSDVAFLKADHDNGSWPAPIVQWYVGRTGAVYLISRGRANHAGSGAGLVKQGIPKDEGNQYFWGIEVQSAGLKQDWTPVQIDAVNHLSAYLLEAMDVGVTSVWRHKDYDDDSGKIDTQYPLDFHRKGIAAVLNGNDSNQEDAEMKDYISGQQAARDAFAKDGKIGEAPSGKGEFFRAGWNDIRWSVANLKGAKGDKGEPGPAGPPGASHSHAKVSVAGPALPAP